MELILYDCRSSKPKNLSHPLVGKLFRQVGLNLLFLAFGGIFLATSPIFIPRLIKTKPITATPSLQANFDQVLAEKLKKQEEENHQKMIKEEAKKFGVTTDFSLVIPRISAAARVIPNVNPADEKEYRPALKSGVAHASGTKFPGENGTIYLFAHSTNSLVNISRYNAVFYQLRDLTAGDKVILFYSDERYIYQVTDNFTTSATDVNWLADNKEEKLILQTCWPPGTSLKRLIVIAKPV